MSNPIDSFDYEVAICGAGPSGLVLANELSEYGINCCIIEPMVEPNGTFPKGQTLNYRSLELLRRLNRYIPEEIRDAQLLPKSVPLTLRYCTSLTGECTSACELTSEESLNFLERVTKERQTRLPQSMVEEILRKKLNSTENSVQVQEFYGWKVEDFKSFNDSCEVLIKNCNNSNKELTLKVKYLIGCDGGRSFIRKSLNIKMEGTGKLSTCSWVQFNSKTLYDIACDHVGPAFLYRLIPGSGLDVGLGLAYGVDSWYMVGINSADDFLLEDENEVKESIYKTMGTKFDCEIVSRHQFNLYNLVATKYVDDNIRVVLCGDAAHMMPPTGGLGMNTGIRDASNLAWRLAAVLRKWGGIGLLKEYEHQQQDIAKRNGAFSENNLRKPNEQKLKGENEKSERQKFATTHAGSWNYYFGYYDALDMLKGVHSIVGYRAPNFRLSNECFMFDKFLTIGYTLVVNSKVPDVNSEDFISTAKNLSIPIKAVYIEDRANKENTRSAYPQTYTLIRPDQHIVWMNNELPINGIQFFKDLLYIN